MMLTARQPLRHAQGLSKVGRLAKTDYGAEQYHMRQVQFMRQNEGFCLLST